MNLNEDSYSYIRHVADQIEGLTCALIVYIENAGSELESYHYEAFNKFTNEIRDMEISVSKEIKDEFVGVKEAIEESAIRIRASESSISQLRSQLVDAEDVFSRLIIHSENIREFNSDTSNPYVPNASEEVYRAFAGYERLLNQYSVNLPLESDTISRLIYSFWGTVSGLFVRLFNEYDSLLQNFGVDVEEKRKNLAALTVIKKQEGKKEIAKAAVGIAKTAAFAALGIKKKNVFDVVESGIGFLAKINDTLEELDKLKYAKPKKSLARKALKGIATYNDAMELVGSVIDTEGAVAEGVDAAFEVPTLAKMAIAIPVVEGKTKQLEEWKESGALDVITSTLGVVEKSFGLGTAIASGKAHYVVKGIVDFGSSGIGLVEKAAKYVNKTYEKDPSMVDQKNMILKNIGNRLKTYNKEVEEYKVAKERKLMAVKKPKAPPFLIVQGVFDKIKTGMCIGTDLYENHAEYYKKGSEAFEKLRDIL
jgi:hypothetical protein